MYHLLTQLVPSDLSEPLCMGCLCAYPALLPGGLHNILLMTDISDPWGLGGPWSIFSPFWGLVTSQLLFLKWRIICRITNKSSQSIGLSEKVGAICEDKHGQSLKGGSIERALRICFCIVTTFELLPSRASVHQRQHLGRRAGYGTGVSKGQLEPTWSSVYAHMDCEDLR